MATAVEKSPNISQKDLDVLASTLGVKYQVEDNLTGGRALFGASITLTNNSDIPLKYQSGSDGWKIFFCHLRMVEPNFLPIDDSVDLQYVGVRIAHLNGSIFSLSPLHNFKTLQQGDSVLIKFNGQHYSASRSDILPNWYIQHDGLEPRVIKCTEGEDLDFVGDFDEPKKYKRFDYVLASGKRRTDTYKPFSPEDRFLRYPQLKLEDFAPAIVPTPVSYCEKSKQLVDISSGDWNIVLFEGDNFLNEAQYLSKKLNIPLSPERLTSQSEHLTAKTITLRKCKVTSALEDNSLMSESYQVLVEGGHIMISANEPVGAFYGVQTLVSLASASFDKKFGPIQECLISDTPRYPYRGMHVDISRNFQKKDEILLLLDVMAMYKLNKFHFHLTDDEGWRLEIPGLEELTQVGALRGHDPEEQTCLLPLLGSGPEAVGLGCGFYSVEDYREILQFAEDRHIEVIPEIDMPGHSHAAVRAMRVRYDRLMKKNCEAEAWKYLLSDPREEQLHKAFSVQMVGDNSMNPGLESTFAFVDKVISELKAMHADIQPLRVFHLGGDEVPYEAWDESAACLSLVEGGKVAAMEDLMEYFVTRVAGIVHTHGLELAAWQDGIVVKNGPYKREKFPNKRVLVHYWRNVWESGQAFDAFKLANDDFEVVLAPGTHLYFDHPQEPDPEERGLFWACRYVDCHKVFCFAPDNLMSNADVKLTGDVLTKSDLKHMQDSETPLKKPHNIKGIQGQIWTELIRTRSQFHAMVFPRLLALAERAWHCHHWETLDSDRGVEMEEDWARFAHLLGHKELQRLEEVNVPYHIPPPGARVSSNGQLELRSCYPGQPLSYSLDEGDNWREYTGVLELSPHVHQVLARVSSHNGDSHSRIVKIKTAKESIDKKS